jgi:hypothetical protein
MDRAARLVLYKSVSLLDGFELQIHVPAAFIPVVRFIGGLVSASREAGSHSDRM